MGDTFAELAKATPPPQKKKATGTKNKKYYFLILKATTNQPIIGKNVIIIMFALPLVALGPLARQLRLKGKSTKLNSK